MVGHLKFPSKMGQKKIYEGGDRSKILFKAGVKTGFILKKRVNAMRVSVSYKCNHGGSKRVPSKIETPSFEFSVM